MTEVEQNVPDKIGGFITGLSVVNFVFAFAMNVFNFTILYLLKNAEIPVLYGGLGISIGQAVLLFVVIPLGRSIDKGRSYLLMAIGSVAYAAVIMLITLASYSSTVLIMASTVGLVALVIIFQNVFKSSLSSFIAKAVRAKILTQSYSRIIWMETAGGTLSFFLVYFAKPFISLRILYFLVGLILLVSSVIAFTFQARENRNALKLQESKVRRPSFMESFNSIRTRGRYTYLLLLTKVFMSVGVLGFSYFYIIIGGRINVSASYALLSLGAASAIGILWGIWSERFVSKHPGWGKIYIVLISLLDVVSYLLILISLYNGSMILFLAAPLIGSPGPFLIPGALSYEVKVVGKENRGFFSGIQRTLTGIPAIVLGAPLTFLFTVNPVYMWGIILASSLATLGFSLLIPSARHIPEEAESGEISPSQA